MAKHGEIRFCFVSVIRQSSKQIIKLCGSKYIYNFACRFYMLRTEKIPVLKGPRWFLNSSTFLKEFSFYIGYPSARVNCWTRFGKAMSHTLQIQAINTQRRDNHLPHCLSLTWIISHWAEITTRKKFGRNNVVADLKKRGMLTMPEAGRIIQLISVLTSFSAYIRSTSAFLSLRHFIPIWSC